MAKVRIGHASKGESGAVAVKGGSAGDQTGKEVCVRYWYLNSKGWVVLRCKDAAMRERIAIAMETACYNPDIGYDQYQRDTLWNNVKGRNYDPGKTTKAVETDCSALVRVCIAYAYGYDLVGNIRTASMPSVLPKTGKFEKLTADKYCKSSDYLLRGDILVTPVSGHTCVVLDNGAKMNSSSGSSNSNTKKEVFTVEMKWLRKGDEGSQVKALQALLIGYGYDLGRTGADGDFGEKTDKAVRKFQSSNGLNPDGVVGDNTWAKLLGH